MCVCFGFFVFVLVFFVVTPKVFGVESSERLDKALAVGRKTHEELHQFIRAVHAHLPVLNQACVSKKGPKYVGQKYSLHL